MPKRIKLQLDSSVYNVYYLCGVHLQDSKLRTDFASPYTMLINVTLAYLYILRTVDPSII